MMDVRAIAAGMPVAELAGVLRAGALKLPETGTGPATGADAIASVLLDLSEAELTALLRIVDPPRSPEQMTRTDDLFRAAAAALARGDTQEALAQLTELAAANPHRAQALASEPALSPVRSEVEQLLSRLTAAAKLDAEGRFEEAVKLAGAGSKDPANGEVRPETMIAVAGRLIECGGYPNFVQSSALSQNAIDQCRWAPVPVPVSDSRPKPTRAARARSRRKMGWRKRLIVIFVVWFALGLAAGLLSVAPEVFGIWAAGLVLLVSIGFYLHVRGLRANKSRRSG